VRRERLAIRFGVAKSNEISDRNLLSRFRPSKPFHYPVDLANRVPGAAGDSAKTQRRLGAPLPRSRPRAAAPPAGAARRPRRLDSARLEHRRRQRRRPWRGSARHPAALALAPDRQTTWLRRAHARRRQRPEGHGTARFSLRRRPPNSPGAAARNGCDGTTLLAAHLQLLYRSSAANTTKIHHGTFAASLPSANLSP
jgi:hypothetical protein